MAERKRSMTKLVNSHLECPICMQIPHGTSIYVCENIHNTCGRCFDKLVLSPVVGMLPKKLCPQGRCSYADPPKRNIIVENLIADQDFEMTCVYDPCNFSGVFGNIKSHEESCPLKPVECPLNECSAKHLIGKLVEHVQTEHKKFQSNDSGDVLPARWAMRACKLTPSTGSFSSFAITKIHGDYFAIHALKKGGSWYSWISIFGEEEDAKKYTCKISVFTVDPKDACSRRKHTYKGPISSVRASRDHIIDGGDTLTLSLGAVMKCSSDEGLSEPSKASGMDKMLSVHYEVQKVMAGKSKMTAKCSLAKRNTRAENKKVKLESGCVDNEQD